MSDSFLKMGDKLPLNRGIYGMIVVVTVFLGFFACEFEEPIPSYTLTITLSPNEGGKITRSPELPNYKAGDVVTLTPEPNEHWVFKQWDGDATGNTTPLQISMNSNKSITGVFVKRDYPLNIKIEGQGIVEEKVIPNPSGREYPHGTRVELKPIPKEGWVFESWGGDLSGNETPQIITVDKEKNVIAKFKRRDYPLNITITGEGTVEEKIVSVPGGKTYPFETVVELKPVPKLGWVFESWGGDLTGNEATKNIAVDKEKNVTVKFKRKDYPLNVTISGEGTVEEKIVSSPGGRSYPYQTVVELAPKPKDGWVFESWAGDLTGSETPKNITVDKEKNVTAKFKRRDYPLNLILEGEGLVEEKIVSSPGDRTYPFQTVVELTPKPKDGWVFESWGGDLTGNEVPKTITVDKEKNVTVKFKRKDYQLNLTITGEGTVEEKIVSTPGGRTYPFLTVVELTPKPKEGWVFESWGGDLTGNEVPKNITVDKEKIVTVKFERKKFLIHSIKVENAPKNMGSVHAIYYLRNNKEYIIDGSVNWNDPSNTKLPLFRIRRGETQWVVENIFSNVDLSEIRNHEILKNGEGFAIADHGPEWPNLPWPHSNLYMGKFSGDNITWEKVSENKSFYHDIAVGDLNSDGVLDVAGAHLGTRFGNPDDPHVYFGNGNGTYKEQLSVLPPGDFPGGCCGDTEIVDFDGDSKNELIGIGGGTGYPNTSIKIWKFNASAQSFQLSKYISNPIPSIAPQTGSYSNLQKGNVSLTGGFTGNMPTNKRFYDLNKDGRKDMIFESDGLTLWYNQGNETFTPFRLNEQGKDLGAYFENYYAMSGYDVIDIENDNDPDIVTRIFTFGNPNTTTGIDLRKLIYINDQGSFDRLTSTDYFLPNAQLSQQYPNMLKAIVRNGYLWFIGPSFKNDGAGPYQIMLEVQTDIPASYWYESQ